MLQLKFRDGGADSGDAVVLQAVGLGEFARLSLPDHPPDELRFSAAYDDASGRIMVSVCGGAVFASPAELASALELPLGPVGLLAGWDAAVFSTAEAIGAVKGFVCDRVLMGCGESGVAVPVEVAAALQLVEAGKAYEVDWGWLVWAVVKREAVAGMPRRYAPYLLHLMVRLRPELFAEDDGRLPLRKRLKGQVLQQCQLTGGMLLDSEEAEDNSLVYGGNQNIGDLEEMPIFGRQNISSFSQLQEVGGNCSYRSSLSFQALMQQIQGYVPDMESRYLDKEKTCRDTRHEVEIIKKMVMEKDHLIEATVKGIKEELKARSVVMRTFEANKDMLNRSVQQYDKLLRKCLDKFQGYMNMVTRGEGIDSYLEVLGITGEQNHSCVQQMHCQRQFLCRFHETCESHYLMVLKKITEMERSIGSLNHEVQRLKNCRSIPDLNNGVEDDGEGKATLGATVGASWTGEGVRVSNTPQGGKQLVELITNPDQRNDTGESVNLNGVQSGVN